MRLPGLQMLLGVATDFGAGLVAAALQDLPLAGALAGALEGALAESVALDFEGTFAAVFFGACAFAG